MRFVPGNPPHLAIRAEYRLTNMGNSPLNFIAVGLPDEKGFGRSNLRAEVGGKGIVLQHEPTEPAGDWRIPFPVSWHQKEKIDLSLSYDLAAQPVSDPRIFVTANTFYLNDSGWFPTLMGFKAFLSPAVGRPDPATLSVTIPANFRVTASGRPRGNKKQNGEVTHQFLIRKADFDPYVLAGQYNEQRINSTNASIVFWTRKPFPVADAQIAASRVSSAYRFYATSFGSLSRPSIFVIESGDLRDSENKLSNVVSSPPPRTVFSPIPVFIEPGADEPFPSFGIRRALAWTWFGHEIKPRPEAWVLAGGLADTAARASESARESRRRDDIGLVLDSYGRGTAVEKPIINLSVDDPYEQIRLGRGKMILFYFALEDKCGQQNVTHAIAHMVYALRGQQYGYSDFRAALEQECHQNLSDFFDVWLQQKGIPADFRARYENAVSNSAKP